MLKNGVGSIQMEKKRKKNRPNRAWNPVAPLLCICSFLTLGQRFPPIHLLCSLSTGLPNTLLSLSHSLEPKCFHTWLMRSLSLYLFFFLYYAAQNTPELHLLGICRLLLHFPIPFGPLPFNSLSLSLHHLLFHHHHHQVGIYIRWKKI